MVQSAMKKMTIGYTGVCMHHQFAHMLPRVAAVLFLLKIDIRRCCNVFVMLILLNVEI